MKNLIYLLFLLIPVITVSCSDDDDDNNDNGNPDTSGAVIIITEDITTPTIWDGNDTVYIIKAYDFYVENSLTIRPGAIIKFHPSAGPYMMVGDGGTIIAKGTSLKPIIFTSYKDDAHGGDNNGDGNATTPAVADWGQINTNGYNSSQFQYCEFFYGGSGSYNSTLILYGNNFLVDRCTFANNKGGKSGDFYYGVLNASDAEKNTTITNNIFYDNIIPLSMESIINIDNSNLFTHPTDASKSNSMNGIFIYSYSDIYGSVTWEETEVPFVIIDNDLWIEDNGSLNLGSAVALKFTPSSTLLIADGGVLNQNSSNTFTSFKDDTVKGDTNGDGSATTPANDDWEGIYDDSGATPNPYYFTWSNIFYDSY